jgi:hypothetical protein
LNHGSRFWRESCQASRWAGLCDVGCGCSNTTEYYTCEIDASAGTHASITAFRITGNISAYSDGELWWCF